MSVKNKGVINIRAVFAISVFVVASIILCRCAFAGETEQMPQFSPSDRVLILSPHPDDEAIATGGIIQKALKAGARVKVVLFSNGDNNEFSFIAYEKRITFRRAEIIHMGEVRRKETIAAMGYLGLDKKDIIFLGYPDFGTMEIFTKYWGNTKPFRTLLSRSAKVPYPECMSPGAPYVGESILNDLKRIIFEFKPTRIFTSHPADTNRDHRALYLFTKVALWDLEGKVVHPQVYPYLVHVEGWPEPRGYNPDLDLAPPFQLKGVSWKELPLAYDEIKTKRDCIAYYKSQNSLSGAYLFSFARKNELFGDYPVMILKKTGQDEMAWHDVSMPEGRTEVSMAALAYALKDDNLFVKIVSEKKSETSSRKITIFLFGYSKDKYFASMPKLRVIIEPYGLSIKDARKPVAAESVDIIHNGNETVLKVPLSLLGNPDHILTNVRASDLHVDATAWRVIDIEK